MNWLSVQTVAQISVERILNALPEGFLIALFAWALLRVLRRQNSGTRFAVWFLALLTVAALPVLGGIGEGQAVAGWLGDFVRDAIGKFVGKPAAGNHDPWSLGAFRLSCLGSRCVRGDDAFGWLGFGACAGCAGVLLQSFGRS